MAFKLFDKAALAVMASRGVKTKTCSNNSRHTVQAEIYDSGTTKVTALTLSLQASTKGNLTCPNTSPTLAIGSTAQNIKTGTFNYSIGGVSYNKTTVAAGTAPTDRSSGAAITGDITGSKFGGLLMYINSSGTVRSIAPEGVAGTQAYESAALCHVGLDTLQDASESSAWCYIGRVVVTAAGGGFTFGTTAFTGVDTYYDAVMPWLELAPYPLSATDISNHSVIFHVADRPSEYIRAMVTAVTGAGFITLRYTPGESL
jgi:hypothetical protein